MLPGATNDTTVKPSGLYAHCAASYNEHLIIYGGRTFNASAQRLQQSGDTWSFDLQRWRWTLLVESSTLEDHPGPRENHACVLQRQSDEEAGLIVVGGLLSSQHGETDSTMTANDVWKLRLRGAIGQQLSARWERIEVEGEAPSPRSDHAVVAVADGLLLHGGCAGSDTFGDTWLLRGNGRGHGGYRWLRLDVPAAPPARCAHTAVPLDGGMLMFGGRAPMEAQPSPAVEEQWRTLGDAWLLEYEYDDAADGGTRVASWRRLRLNHSSGLHLARSDAAAVLRVDGASGRRALLLQGGLSISTDAARDTMYIHRDLVEVALPAGAPLPDAPTAVGLEGATDWPSYRFDASMVIVPEVQVDGILTLLDAPLLYGGGGGTDVFDDLWAYDAARGEFVRLDTTAALPRPWAREELAEDGASSSPSVLVAVAASLALVAACVVVGLGVWRLTGRRHRARRALAYVHHREAEGSPKATRVEAAAELAMTPTAVSSTGGADSCS